MTKLLRQHDLPPQPSSRPYRDTAISNGVLGTLIVVLAWATAGGVGRALLIAVGYFVASTGWVWWRLRERIRRAAGKQGTS